MLTPNELVERINSTTLSEAIDIFEEKVLTKSLDNYDNSHYKHDVKRIMSVLITLALSSFLSNLI